MKRSIYLITRLYNTADKIRTCELELFLKEKYKDISIYMPYRDINEDRIENNWKDTIFRKDIEAINNSDILLGYWDGTEFDEGIGFEIGYAISKGKKILILNSDFLKYQINYCSCVIDYPDPLIEILGIKFIKNVFEMSEASCFYEDLLTCKKNHFDLIDLDCLDSYDPSNGISKDSVYDIYIECGNSKLYHLLYKKKNAKRCYISTRYLSDDAIESSKEDLSAILNSKQVYIVLSGVELNMGSSILSGLCFGFNIPFYLVNDRLSTMLSMSGAEMPANLMIDCAAKGYIDPGLLI